MSHHNPKYELNTAAMMVPYIEHPSSGFPRPRLLRLVPANSHWISEGASLPATLNQILVPVSQESPQQESQEVWKSIELAIESDVLITQLDTVFYVRKSLFFQQIVQ